MQNLRPKTLSGRPAQLVTQDLRVGNKHKKNSDFTNIDQALKRGET